MTMASENMSDDIRAAAERLRRVKNGEPSKIVYGYGDGPLDDIDCDIIATQRQKDEKLLADAHLAYLELVPADDGEPVTIEWMVEQDWFRESETVVTHADVSLYVSFSSTPPVVFVEVYELGTVRTRGEVRRLLVALGVTT